MALTRITKGVIKPNENYDTHNINSTGIVTAIGLDVNGNGDISGNLSVGGVLTYEDVTSIDSVGIITAQKDIHVGAGVSAVGIGTFSGLDINGDLDVDGHTNLDNVSVAGVTTFSDDVIFNGANFDITYDRSLNTVNFDQSFLKFGTSGQLVFRSTGPLSTIDSTTGLRMTVGSLEVLQTSGDKMIKTYNNGAVELYHDDNLRLTTSTKGIQVGTGVTIETNGQATFSGITTFAGNINLIGELNTDTARIRLPDGMNGGPFTGNLEFGNNRDFVMLHDGHHNYVRANNGNIYITVGGNVLTTLQTNGTVLLNKDLDVDGHTNLDNVSIAGVTTMSGNLTISNTAPVLKLVDTDNNSDFSIYGAAGVFNIYDETNSASRLLIASDGTITAIQGLVCSSTLTIPDSIIHSGDTNTKIRFPSNDTISFEIAGNEKFRLDTSGNARFGGGGTSAGTDGVHIYHASSNQVLLCESGDAYAHIGIRDNSTHSSGTYFGVHGNDFRWVTHDGSSSSEKLRITSGGKIGVNYTGTPPAETMMISSGDSTTGLSLSHLSGGNRYGFRLSTIGGTNKGLIISPFFNSGYTEALRIDANGYLGVGLDDPHLYYSPDLVVKAAADSGGITIRSAGTTHNNYLMFADSNSGDARYDGYIKYNHNGRELQFATATSVKLTITSSGKIGINETSPFAELDIASSVEDSNGSISQHGIRLYHEGAANEEVIPISATFVTQQARARAGIGFISKTISGSAGMGGAVGFYTRNTADGHGLYTTDERARVTETGVLLVGHTSSPTSDSDKLQVISTSSGTGLCLHNYSASNYGNNLAFMKSRSNTIGTNTILQSGDRIGELNFYGNDGSGRSLGAQISVRISGTPSNNNTPAAMYFMNGTNQSMSTRLSILPAGTVGISKNGWASSDNSFALTVHTGSTSDSGNPVNDGIMIVSQNSNGNQNSSTGKLMFCGHAQTNGPFLYADNEQAYGKKGLVFHTLSTSNSYSTQLEETARFTYGGRFGLGTGTAVDSLMHIQGNSDNGDEACMLTIEDEDTTAGSKIPSIVFKGNGSQQHRIRGTDTGGLTFADSGNNVRFIISNGAEAGAAQLGRDSRGWATFRHSDHQGLRTHVRQHYAPGNAVSTYDILRIKRHWWGWGTYKIRLKALYYYGSQETTYYVNGHGSGGDSYSIVKETAHNNDWSAATVTKSAASSSSPGNSTTYFIDVRVNVPNYMYMTVYVEAYSSQYSTDPTNMGADSYCLL